MLHLGLEVPHSGLMEVLDLSQCGERDDVAAFPDPICLLALHLPFLYMLLAFLHLRQSTCEESGTRMRLNIDFCLNVKRPGCHLYDIFINLLFIAGMFATL